ncbi:MAG: DUF6603 domain-containing protein [Saprospiraceae bacterium]|nr:DUF6603 domain-containing protein [Saprospiraceae bacterium]
MATSNENAFRPLLIFFKEVLDNGIAALNNPAERTQILTALGLDPTQVPDPGQFPSLDEVQTFINKVPDFDLAAFGEAITKITEVVTKLINFLNSAATGPGPDGKQLLNLFLNIFVLKYIDNHAPEFRKVIDILNSLAPTSPSSVARVAAADQPLDFNFVEEIIVKFFDKISKGKSEEAVNDVEDLPFILLAAILQKVDKALSTEAGGDFTFKTNFSSLNPGSPDEKPLFILALGKPEDGIEATFGGGAGGFPVKLKAETDVNFEKSNVFGSDKRLTLSANLEGHSEFTIGESPGGNVDKFARANFLHRRDDEPLWTILSSPAFRFVPGTYQLDAQFTNDDVAFTLRFDLKYEFGRGGLSGFPFDFLPENERGKQTIEFGWSMKRSFFGGSSSVGAGEGAPFPSAAIARNAAAPATENDPVNDVLSELLNLISVTIPLHQNIGGILGLETLYLAGSAGQKNGRNFIGLEASLDFWLKFGTPITISVNRLGVLLNLEKTADGTGVLGYDIKPDIKFPNGAGVRVNAGVVTGGGFLNIDQPKGEYFGALQLSFKNLFDLKAVGIINTKDSDGNDIFSMFILVTAEFSAIQLGFGFTLLGVGGMLGVNRGMDVEPIRVGLRTGAIQSILFPEDVVGNIQRIISDIKQIFPIKEGSFVIGLMAKIGWGTPTLISAELGVMVELPDPKVVILGVIKCILPSEEAPLLKLQINFLGVIDFQNEFIYFEARLFESSIVGITLTGSMAFVVAWGKNSTFGISVGGFHPDFKDYPTVPTLPGAFRDMDRIGLQLLSGDNPRLGVEAYFAVTSNSVQFGARVELYAGGPFGFNLYGLLAFDALFIFEPFRFVISLEATLAIRHNTSILFGIHFRGKLAGPRPWNVEGEVSFSVFPFVTITIGFDVTWGDPALPATTNTKDLIAVFKTEVRNNSNWKVELPDYHNLFVSLREFDEVEQALLIVHPFGKLVFSQRALPLDFEIEQFGTLKPLNLKRLSITKITAGNNPDATKNITLNISDVQELFAAGNYSNLSESEKLSRKSFETFNSGKRLEDVGNVKSVQTPLILTDVDYELDYTGDDAPVAPTKNDKSVKMRVEGFDHLRRNAAVSKSAVSWDKIPGLSLNSPEPVQIIEQEYFVVRESNMEALIKDGIALRAATKTEAIQKMRAWESLNPDDSGVLQVVELHELI